MLVKCSTMPFSQLTLLNSFLQKLKFKSDQKTGIFYIILAGCLWGLSGVIGQYLLQTKHVNTAWMIAIRMWLPGLILLMMCYHKYGRQIYLPLKNRKDFTALTIFSIFGILASQLCYFLTVKYSNAATATILQYLYPIIIAIILTIYLKKLPSFYVVLSIILAITGTFCIITNGSIHQITLSTKALTFGSITIMASVVYTLYPIPLLHKYNTSTIAGWGMLIGGILLNFFYPFWHPFIHLNLVIILDLIIVIFGGGMLGFLLYLIGIKLLGGSKGSILATVEPLAAVLFSVFLLHIKFTLMDWIGTACIISMIIILALKNV